MNKDIMLSIIMPIYNAEAFIEKTFDCIFPQLNSNTELILINDGSTDNTYEIINSYITEYFLYESQDTPIVIVLNQSNGGCSKARNYGLNKCNGKYVIFVDSDDVVKSDYLSKLTSIINENIGFDVCITGVETYDEFGNLYEIVQNPNAYFDTHDSAVKAIITEKAKLAFPMWSKIIRVDFLREYGIEFDDDAVCMSDGLFYTNIYQHIQNLLLSDYVGYEWRRRPGSISARYYDITIGLANRYADNCKKIIDSSAELKHNEIAEEWLQKKKKFAFDYIINRIDASNIAWDKRKNEVRKAINECLEFNIIDEYYFGIDRILLYLAKKNNSYFYYGLLQGKKKCVCFCERLYNAIKRRVIRR